MEVSRSDWSEIWMMSTRYLVKMGPQLYIHVVLDSNIG